GREQVAQNWSLMFAEVPDLKLDVLRAAVAGDEVWTEIRVHGQKVDGRSFEYRGMAVWGLRDDLIAWARPIASRSKCVGLASTSGCSTSWTEVDRPRFTGGPR